MRKNSDVFPVLISISSIRGNEGTINYHLGTFKDISEIKRLEEQLQIRQRMDSLGTLAGGIAHDFNNILVCIIGYIEMLKFDSANLTDTQKEYLSNAGKNCERAANLIHNFQSLSRMTVSEKGNVDVYTIPNEVFTVFKETTNRLIEKKVDINPQEYFVHANPDELHQVFMNLATNAIHAIEEQGVKTGDYIKISAHNYINIQSYIKELQSGAYIHILFEDSGIGMSKEVKKRAFDPLFTPKNKGKQKGQGVGLAMVYNIITRIHRVY